MEFRVSHAALSWLWEPSGDVVLGSIPTWGSQPKELGGLRLSSRDRGYERERYQEALGAGGQNTKSPLKQPTNIFLSTAKGLTNMSTTMRLRLLFRLFSHPFFSGVTAASCLSTRS